MKALILLLISACLANTAWSQIHIADSQATKHFRQSVRVTGKISGSNQKRNGNTYLNMGGKYPNHLVSILIKAKDSIKFRNQPNEEFIGKEVEIAGLMKKYKGKPLIVVSSASQIHEIPNLKGPFLPREVDN